MIEETLNKLLEMKMRAMREKALEILNDPTLNVLSWQEALTMVVESEFFARLNRRIDTLIKRAGLKYNSASLESISYGPKRGLSKQTINTLRDLQFILKGHNVCISGSTGTGKSYLACCLGNLACRNGLPTIYKRVGTFLDELCSEKALGNYANALEKIKKTKLLILDDLGSDTLDKQQRRILLDVIDDFYLERSVIITSQVPADKWDLVIGDQTTAEAICDRLFHHCYRINLKGPSLRR